MSYFKVLVVMIIALVFVGCAGFATLGVGNSRLATLEEESTLDKMETVQGVAAQDGNHMSRREFLAEQEILNRKVQAEKNKGLRVEVANYGYYVRTFELRKAGFLINPMRASFILPADSVKIIYLMPGFYELKCFGGYHDGSSLVWSKVYEVTSAPSYDGISGEETHCTMGNIDDSRRGRYRHRR